MEIIVTTLEIIGAIAFAVSGALVGIRKNMDVFGVCVLGLSTAVGGGVIRDLILGETPPAMFTNPIYAIAGLATCLFVLIPEIRTMVERSEFVLLLADAVGLGIFTASGTMHALETADANAFLAVFVGVVTGVGGGLLRDVMASVPPRIFSQNTNIIPGNSVLMFAYISPIIIHVLYILTDIRAYSVVSCHKPKLEQNS